MQSKFLLLAILPCALFAQTITTVASNNSWSTVSAVLVERTGNYLVVDQNRHAIYRVTPQGVMTVFAGTPGQNGFAGDGGPATSAKLNSPDGITADSNGNVYIADTDNNRIRRVSPAGVITTFAGTGSSTFGGDGAIATSAALDSPHDVAVDAQDNVIIADSDNYRIRRVGKDGNISTIAGTGYRNASGNGGPALLASLGPYRLCVLADGTIYFSDTENYRVRRIGSDGIITAIAGTGTNQNTGTGGQATAASLMTPSGLVVDRGGNLYIATYYGNTVRKIAPNGVITTFAGTGAGGSTGDRGSAATATLYYPDGLALDLDGSLLIAESGSAKIRRVGLVNSGTGAPFGSNTPPPSFAPGTISTAAGNSAWGTVKAVTEDSSGNLYVADDYYHVVYKSTPQGQWTIVAGIRGNSGFSGDGGPANEAKLNAPSGVALSTSGVLYIADSANHRIRAVNPNGTVTTFAGTGASEFKGDGQAAQTASLSYPNDVAVDSQGNLLIADSGNNRIRKVDGSGTITTIAGTGYSGVSGDGGLALIAPTEPNRLTVTNDGSIYFTDYNNHRVRRVGPDGIITTIAGTGNAQNSGDGGPSSRASINNPSGVTIDSAGNIYVSSAAGNTVRKIAPDGTITTIAGNAGSGSSGDQGPATAASLSRPLGLGIDHQGNLLIADYYNARVRKVLLNSGATPGVPYGTNTSPLVYPNGTISSIAGNSTWGQTPDVAVDPNGNLYVPDQYNHVVYRVTQQGTSTVVAGMLGNAGFSGDGGPSTSARLNTPTSVAVDANGTLYIADNNNHRIRSVSPGGMIQTIAGNGSSSFGGDGGAATTASLSFPYDVALDARGSLLIVDSGNNRIRKVDETGTITTIAGTGFRGVSGDGGSALVAATEPNRLTAVADGSIYFTDYNNHRVRRVGADGIIATIAGTGNAQNSGDGGPSSRASINNPAGVTVDPAGNIYVSSAYGNRVRRIASDGTITTIAGTGENGSSGDQGPATAARLNRPLGLAIDHQRNLLIADFYNARIRKVLLDVGATTAVPYGTDTAPIVYPSGTISSVAGNNTWGLPPDVAVDPNGNLYVPDQYTHVVYRVTPQGESTIVAGTPGNGGFSGDGGPAIAARLNNPTSVAVDANGTLYIADNNNHRIRSVSPGGTIQTFAGNGSGSFGGDGGVATAASLNYPYDIALDAQGSLLIVDSYNYRIRKVNSAGIISTIVGTGTRRLSGDGGPATVAAIRPGRLAPTPDGSLYFTDSGNFRIRRVSPGGTITTIAGTGEDRNTGDGGQARLSAVGSPEGIAIDFGGNIYISSYSQCVVRRITPDGIITTVAGNGSGAYSGDQGKATAASLNRPAGLTIDSQGNLLIADFSNARIRRVLLTSVPIPGLPFGSNIPSTIYPAGTISTTAGNSTWGNAADVAIDRDGNSYVADSNQHVIYKTTPQGDTTVVAGTFGSSGSSGDGGLATQAKLNAPTGIAVSGNGVLYIADYQNHRIRKVGAGGSISTIAGTGSSNFSGDGKAATAATLSSPYDVALDAAGNVLIVDSGNARIRRVDTSGIISTIGGNGNRSFSGDGGRATSAAMQPTRLAPASNGSIYFSDGGNNRVRRIGSDGMISTIAGTGASQTNGDGGLATAAAISSPEGIVLDSSGNIYVASFSANVVRRIDPRGIITTFAGTGSGDYSGDQGPATSAALNRPAGLDLDPQGNLVIADYYNARVRKVLLAPAGGTAPQVLLLVTPPSLTFTAPAGSTDLLSGSVDVNASVPMDTDFEVLVPMGNPWLRAEPTVGTTPASVRFTVDPSQLNATAQTTVTVKAGTATFAVPVRVNLGHPSAFSFQVMSPSVSLRPTGTGIYDQQSIPVKNTSDQSGTVTGRVLGGAAWLSLSPTQIELPPGGTGQFSVALKPSALDLKTAGFAQANLAFRSTSDDATVPDQSVAVVASITGETVPVPVIVPQKLTLFTQLNKPSSWFTQFYIGNAGTSPVDWHLTSTDTAVSVAPLDRIGLYPSTKLENVQVQLTPGADKFVTLGPHQTLIALRFGNPGNEYHLNLPVTIEVRSPNTTLPLRVFPAGLFASYPAGGPAVFNDALTVTNPLGRARTFKVSTDAPWLQVPSGDITIPGALSSASVAPPPSVTVPITLNPDLLPSAGTRGNINITESDVVSQVVEVLYLSAAPQGVATSIKGTDRLTKHLACSGKQLFGVMTSLGPQFRAIVGLPQTVEVNMVDSCGYPVTTGSVTAIFSSGQNALTLTPLGDGRWSTAWTPGAEEEQITITILASSGGASGSFPVTGKIAGPGTEQPSPNEP